MRNKLKLFYYRNKRWFYNLQYILVSVLLLILVTYIDTAGSQIQAHIPRAFLSSVDLAKTVLASLAGALLTITTFTFSTILSVLVLYNNKFTPRSIENFADKRITMKVLGIFIGGFVYSIISLNFMRAFDGDRLVIAGTIGVIYSIFCVVYFVIFIQNVIVGLQISNVVMDVYNKTEAQIEKEVEHRNIDFIEPDSDESSHQTYTIEADETGYLDFIDFVKTKKLLKDVDGTYTIEVKIGDFIMADTTLGRLVLTKGEVNDELLQGLEDCYAFGDTKITEEDYHVGLERISEIATIALSTGINDPNSAIDCMRKHAVLLSKLACVKSHYHVSKSESNCSIYYTSHTFYEDLVRFVSPITTYGSKDPSVISALFEGLLIIYEKCVERNKKVVQRIAKEVFESVSPNFDQSMDIARIEQYYKKIVPE